MRVQNTLVWGVLGALSGSFFGAFLNGGPLLSQGAQAQVDLAQVNNADLACYLHSLEGVQFDLSALCAGFTPQEEVVLQTGDVQVTLRWDTADDLDLYVRDPFGDEVYYGNREVASGGMLDVDANAGCGQQMASPVENIFWPTGGGAPGDYVITVDLFSYCGPEVPISFTLTTLVQGDVQTQMGTVSSAERSVSFPFVFPAAGGAIDGAEADATSPDAQDLPTAAPTGLPAIPSPVGG